MLALAAMTGMVADMVPQAERLREAAGTGFSTATDLADWLVRRLDLPFREAHHVTGALVKAAETRGVDLPDLTLDEMQRRASRHQRRGLRRARRRQLGGEPDELWRDGAGPGAGAGGALARGAGVRVVAVVLLLALAACGIKGEPDPRVDLPPSQIAD